MAEDRSAAGGLPPFWDGVDEGEWEDPIVAEVHAIRARLWEEAGGTMDGLFTLLKASEAARGMPRPAPDVAQGSSGDARSG